MRNLKKVLSLVLCLAMMLSVMVVGAGAAFTDQDAIDPIHAEAVDACVALNIITGYPEGDYQPNGEVTRAQMCKMICIALNGGKEPVLGESNAPTFTDTKGHWAEAYIESCVSQGIVAGMGDGKFNPEGKVTATQAAKMLLIALGYDADHQKYLGDSWAINVNTDASAKGLYVDLTDIDANAPLTREHAAQMIWNVLNAYVVEYTTTLIADENGQLTSKVTVADKVIGNNKDKITLLSDKYEADTAIGIYAGNSDVANVKDGNIKITNATINGKTLLDNTNTPIDFVFKYDLSLDYLGEELKVLYKDGKDGIDGQLDDKDIIYGVYLTGATSAINAVMDDIDDNYNTAGKVSVDDVAYKVADSGRIIFNYNGSSASNQTWSNATAGVAAIEGLSAQNGNTVKFILDDEDKIDTVYVVEYFITKVTAVNSSKVSLYGVGSIDIEDNIFEDDIAKDDVVVYNKLYDDATANATFVISLAEVVEGDLTGYNNATSTTIKKLTIDGDTYSVVNKALASNLTDDYVTNFSTSDINSAVVAYLVNGFVGCVDMPDAANNYALIESASSAGSIGGADEFKMKVILANGDEMTVTVDEDSNVTTESSLRTAKLVKYASISDSNVMDVDSIVTTVNAATYGGTNIYDKDTKTFAGVVTTADAVLFVKTTDAGKTNYYAYDIRSLGNILNDNATGELYAVDKDGKVEAAYVELTAKPTSSTSDTVYGIVTAANGTVKVGDEYKAEYKVASSAGEYTVYMPTSSAVVKGDIVSFDKASDDIYGNGDVTVYTMADAKYIYELDKDNVLSYYDSIGGTLITKALDDDAQIVYVNQDKDKAGDEIGVDEYDTIDKYANAVVVLGTDGKITAVIVESSGECNVINGMSMKTTLANTVSTTAAVQAMPDGVYFPTCTSQFNGDAGDSKDVVIFKYTADGTSSYTLDLLASDGTTSAGTLTLTPSTAGGALFYINTSSDPADVYSWTITKGTGASATVIMSGTYVVD